MTAYTVIHYRIIANSFQTRNIFATSAILSSVEKWDLGIGGTEFLIVLKSNGTGMASVTTATCSLDSGLSCLPQSPKALHFEP